MSDEELLAIEVVEVKVGEGKMPTDAELEAFLDAYVMGENENGF